MTCGLLKRQWSMPCLKASTICFTEQDDQWRGLGNEELAPMMQFFPLQSHPLPSCSIPKLCPSSWASVVATRLVLYKMKQIITNGIAVKSKYCLPHCSQSWRLQSTRRCCFGYKRKSPLYVYTSHNFMYTYQRVCFNALPTIPLSNEVPVMSWALSLGNILMSTSRRYLRKLFKVALLSLVTSISFFSVQTTTPTRATKMFNGLYSYNWKNNTCLQCEKKWNDRIAVVIVYRVDNVHNLLATLKNKITVFSVFSVLVKG